MYNFENEYKSVARNEDEEIHEWIVYTVWIEGVLGDRSGHVLTLSNKFQKRVSFQNQQYNHLVFVVYVKNENKSNIF